MKKIIYTLLAAVLMVSCSSDDLDRLFGNETITEGKAYVDFSVLTSELPASVTRAGISGADDIQTMKVVVYDENGIYVEQADATLNPSGKTGKWQAYLSLSDKPRYIHFLANYTEEIPYGTESESQTIAKLSSDSEVYWQRVKLDHITAILVGDGGSQHLAVTSDVSAKLDNIKLIRNYAKVTISAAEKAISNFALEAAAIYSMPSEGTLAPYSSETSTFVEGYENKTTPEALINGGYMANVPAQYNMIAKATELTDVDGEGKVLFNVFEREVPDADPAFLIVKGKYNGDAESSYFRINLRKNNGEYFPVLRNFEYQIVITDIQTTGYSSIDDAISSAGSGDISTDIRYRNLTNISNGDARIFVSETDMMIVNNDPVEIKYSFIPDLANPSITDNPRVQVTLGDADAHGAVFTGFTNNSGTDGDGFSTITLTPNMPDDVVKKQTLTLKGEYMKDGKTYTITREVVFTLRKKPEFKLQVLDNKSRTPSDNVAAVANTPFALRVGVPDGLPRSLFPLDIAVEAEELTITSNLPVATGKSLFGNGTPAYQFIYQLSYSDYLAAENDEDGFVHFEVPLKTNTAQSASRLMVANKYFVSKETSFKNASKKFTDITFSNSTATSTDINFSTDDTNPVTLYLDNLVPAAGATGIVKVSDGVYTYTPSASGSHTLPMKLVKDEHAYKAAIAGDDYLTNSVGKLYVKDLTDFYTKSDYTTRKCAVVPGFTTTLTACVSFCAPGNGSVKFVVNGSTDVPATKVRDENGYSYFTADYMVPLDYSSPTISVKVVAEESLCNGESGVRDMDAWKLKVTQESTTEPLTTVEELNARTIQAGFMSAGKRIWKGIVLKDKNYGGYIYKNENALKVLKNPSDLTTNVKYCFQSNGSDYLRTYDGKYLNFTNDANAVNIYDTNDGGNYKPNIVKVDDAWYIHSTRSGYTGYKLQNNNGTLRLGNSTDNNTRWQAYPVTVEYISY